MEDRKVNVKNEGGELSGCEFSFLECTFIVTNTRAEASI